MCEQIGILLSLLSMVLQYLDDHMCDEVDSILVVIFFFFFFSSRRRHTRLQGDWSSDVCSSDLGMFTDRPNSNETAEALQGNPPVTYSPTLYYGNLATFTGAAGYRSEERRVG